MYHYKTSGLDNIYLKNGYVEKDTPSGKTIAIRDLDGLHKAIARGLVNKSHALTGKEFRFLRTELDLSQKALGLLFEKTDQAIAIWEKGDKAIPALADKAIRDLYMESIGESPIAHLLDRFAKLDRKACEFELQMEETSKGWLVKDAA